MYDCFSGNKFGYSERNTKNTMSHLYVNGDSDYSEKNTSKNEAFCSTRQRNLTYSRLSCRFITYNVRIEHPDWRKCKKRPLEVFCEKRYSLKFRKIHKKHLCQRKHM